PRVGFVAGLLFAVVPAVSRYAQEARPYALVTMFAVLSTLLLTRLAERRGAGRVVAYAASVTALGLLHPLALSLLAAHVVVVLVAERQAFARWAAGAVAGAVPGGVLLWLGYRQQSQVSWIPLARLSSLAEYPGEVFGAALGAGVILALALFAVSLRRPAVVYSAWALVPTALVFAAGTAIPLWLPRYLLFTIPAWVLLAATALGRYPVIRGLVAIAAVAVLAVPAQSQLRAVDGHSQDTRQLAALIASLSRPGDGIVYGTLDRGGGWIARDTVAHYVPAEQQPTDLLAERPQRTGGHLLAAECPAIVKCLGRTDRVWLVRLGETDNPLVGIGKPKMEAFTNYDVVKTWRPRGFTLALLLRRPG
ncbi:MAG: hypothetical protein QOI35_651, partial [Cryptosporangiaceae bacterium]|nr:hypothetical protein [Cryptosporangiaceae bacterium]